MTPVLRAIDPRLREAAATLGASPARVWREVDLPIVARAALVAAGFAFAISLGEFGATVFIVRPDDADAAGARSTGCSASPGPLNFGARDGGERDPDGADRARDPRHRALPRRIGRRASDAASSNSSPCATTTSSRVDAVDLEVADGEIVCVLGPSGSGKSTLLRAVAGLEPDATGRVSVGRRRPRRRPAAPARVRPDVPGPRAVPAPRRASATSRSGCACSDVPRAEIDARAARRRSRSSASPASSTGGSPSSRAASSSGSRSPARSPPAPRLLMLDEPLGALDRALRERLVAELRALFVRLGLTILFVTHDHDEAFALADRVVVMHAGPHRAGRAARPRSGDHPADAFVARFLGWNVTGRSADSVTGRGRSAPKACGSRPRTREPRRRADRRRRRAGTFRRDHFLVEVELDAVVEGDRRTATAPSALEVAVARGQRRCPRSGDAVGDRRSSSAERRVPTFG